MKKNKYDNIIEQLNKMLNDGGVEPSNSSLLGTSGEYKAVSPDSVFVEENMDLDKMSEDELLLTHTLLHRFNSSGNKNLSKELIKTLHDKVKLKVKHSHFDRLDD